MGRSKPGRPPKARPQGKITAPVSLIVLALALYVGGGLLYGKLLDMSRSIQTKDDESSAPAGVLGSCAEFACEFLVALRPLSKHVLGLNVRYTPLPLPRIPLYERLQNFETTLPQEVLVALTQQVRRLDDHFQKLSNSGQLPRHTGYMADVLGGDSKSPATLNLRFYNIFSLDAPVVADLYWAVKNAFHHYRLAYDMPATVYLVHGWFTCFRRDDLQMGFHVHNQALGSEQVSGNIPLDVSPCAATEYVLTESDDSFGRPDSPAGVLDPAGRDVHTNPMVVGQMTLFDGRTPHRIKPEEETVECAAWWAARPEGHCRASAAFDILPHNHMPALHQAVILYDPADEEWRSPKAQEQRASRMNEQVVRIQQKMGLSGRLDSSQALLEDMNRLDIGFAEARRNA